MNHRIGHILGPLAHSLYRLAPPTLVIVLGLLATLWLNSSAAARSSEPPSLREHIGRLEPTLFPAESRAYEKTLVPATASERAALPGQLAPTDRVFVGETTLPKGKRLKLALVEPARGDSYLFADVNLDGRLEPSERFTFAGKQPLQMILNVQLPIGPFKIYPVRLLLPPARKEISGGKGSRMVALSFFVFVQGVVQIGGKRVRALYDFDPDKSDADPDDGWIGMDTNGDGIVNESNSDEFTFAKHEVVLFGVNGRDVSTASIDLKSMTFVVLEHPAGANTRISLRVGETLSDFAFTAVDGKLHHFSDFRGQYVLLDFWETSCPPCRAEMPFIEKAWRRFHSRGFVALGINDNDDGAKKAREFLTQQGISFPQVIGPTGLQLVEKRFRIEWFPREVLVNPAGKIIAMDDSLRGKNLEATLGKVLPVSR